MPFQFARAPGIRLKQSKPRSMRASISSPYASISSADMNHEKGPISAGCFPSPTKMPLRISRQKASSATTTDWRTGPKVPRGRRKRRITVKTPRRPRRHVGANYDPWRGGRPSSDRIVIPRIRAKRRPVPDRQFLHYDEARSFQMFDQALDLLGFSHFVTSMTAPVASGWSGWPGGIRTHWKAPPCHGAHVKRT